MPGGPQGRGAARQVLQRGDHRAARHLHLNGPGVRRAIEEAEQLRVLGPVTSRMLHPKCQNPAA